MDWKALRKARGLKLRQVAELSGYSVGTINGLERTGEGSERLKAKLMEVLGYPQATSAGMALREEPPENALLDEALVDLALIKERIRDLETKLRKLKK